MTACLVMADLAEDNANIAINENPNNPKAALARFDELFSKLYHGGPMKSVADARRWSNGTGGEINPFYRSNGSGFQER